MVPEDLSVHTHAQYVALRNNEDRLIGERFTALLFASSFLAVVWSSADSIGWEGRLIIALLGLFLTLLIWRMNFRSAEAAQDWRALANEEEKLLYGSEHDGSGHSKGPYGLRMTKDDKRADSEMERLFHKLDRPGMGSTNVISAFWVPVLLYHWWLVAIGFAIGRMI